MHSACRLAVMIAMLVCASAARCRELGAQKRFQALFFDGSLAASAVFEGHGWWDDRAMLAGRRLFGTQNPVRMLEDVSLHGSLTGPCVLLANGDVLPGEVVECLPPLPKHALPSRLLVAPSPPLVALDPRGLEIRTDRVLRLAANAKTLGGEEPGRLVLTGGSQRRVASVRWRAGGIQALTEHDLVDVSFAEIADLHLPKVDTLAAVLDDGLFPPQGPDATVARLEAVHGAVLTYHRDMSLLGVSRTGARTGRGSRPDTYLHLQPAWSLAPLLVPIESVRRQSFRAAAEVPLSVLPAAARKQRAGIHAWPWRRNQNVEGEPLSSGHVSVDLGVGTHSYCEIAFELPPGAAAFTSLVGIDRSIGPGACARCRIFADRVAGQPLFQSDFLRGRTEPVPVGPLPLTGAKRLVLVTDFGHDDRPADAYPLDIGDHVNWLMPLVTIDEDAAQRREALRRFIPGWSGWNLEPADVASMRLGLHWDEAQESWLPILHANEERPLVLTRTISGNLPAGRTLELRVAFPIETKPPAIELRAGRQRLEPEIEPYAVAAGSLPQPGTGVSAGAKTALAGGDRPSKIADRPSDQDRPRYQGQVLRWRLDAFRGKQVELRLSIPFDQYRGGLLWHGCRWQAVAETPPPPTEGR